MWLLTDVVICLVKSSQSVTGSAWGKMNLTSKALTEGGFESLYKQNFTTYPNEKLNKTFACYMSTSTGPVAGTLYLSNIHVAFCSDRPLAFKQPNGMESWIYYKVLLTPSVPLCFLLCFESDTKYHIINYIMIKQVVYAIWVIFGVVITSSWPIQIAEIFALKFFGDCLFKCIFAWSRIVVLKGCLELHFVVNYMIITLAKNNHKNVLGK